MRKVRKRQGTRAKSGFVVEIADAEVRAIGMLENERADAGFGIHHHAFGKLHADFFGAQKLPDADLIIEIRARGISKAVAFAAIA